MFQLLQLIMSSELKDRELKLSRSISSFSNFFRYTSNLFFSNAHSVSNSLQQSQSDTSIFRQLLNIMSSKCSRIRNNKYVIYDRSYYNEFVQWWNQISWTLRSSQKKRDHVKSNWDNIKNRKSHCWNHFFEITNIDIEKSRMQCKICHKFLTHSTSRNQNSNDLKWHLNRTDNCKSLPDFNQSTLNLTFSIWRHSHASFTRSHASDTSRNTIDLFRTDFFWCHNKFHCRLQCFNSTCWKTIFRRFASSFALKCKYI